MESELPNRAETASGNARPERTVSADPKVRRKLISAEERAKEDKVDAQLMERFKSGDAAAFGDLVQRHRKAVFHFCLRMLRERTAAEDAMQEVFLRVVRGAKKWEHQAKFSTWLYTIARNHCIDAIRKASYRKTASLDQSLNQGEEQGPTLGDRVADEDAISPDRGAASIRLRGALADAIASLSQEQREVFVMRQYSGMPFKEIAEIVGVSENTVKSRMRYALEHMRGKLKKAGVTPR